jgi:hypothetical protein
MAKAAVWKRSMMRDCDDYYTRQTVNTSYVVSTVRTASTQ